MDSLTGTPERMGARKGAQAARAGKKCKPDIHWPKSIRDAYRLAYERTQATMERERAH